MATSMPAHSTAMPARFLTAGLRFFATALLFGFVLLAVAPIDAIRLLCVFALVCAAAGLILHFVALRAIDPGALAALRAQTGSQFRGLRNDIRRALNATHEATDTVWPCALR
jgi:ABC-type phosphate/phosphonate transport system permease subunit